MTVPYERTNAVINTEQFLYDLCDSKKTPRVPKSVRQEAHRLLRHYPSQYEMNMIADREDSMQFGVKVFGKDFM
jgi:hypothetical protein